MCTGSFPSKLGDLGAEGASYSSLPGEITLPQKRVILPLRERVFTPRARVKSKGWLLRIKDRFGQPNGSLKPRGRMHTLPRADRTFTAADIIRFWCRNLDSFESFQVLMFFVFIAAPIQLETITSTAEDILENVPALRGTVRFIALLNRALRVLSGLSPRILSSLFDTDTFDVIVECLEEL